MSKKYDQPRNTRITRKKENNRRQLENYLRSCGLSCIPMILNSVFFRVIRVFRGLILGFRSSDYAIASVKALSLALRTNRIRATGFELTGVGLSRSAEAAGYVVFGLLHVRARVQLFRGAGFDQAALIEEGCEVRDPGRLLHVVRDDDDRKFAFQLEN